MIGRKVLLVAVVMLVACLFVVQGSVYAGINSEYKKPIGSNQTTEGKETVDKEIIGSNNQLLAEDNTATDDLTFTVSDQASISNPMPKQLARNFNAMKQLKAGAGPNSENKTCDFELSGTIKPVFFNADSVMTMGGEGFLDAVGELAPDETPVIIATGAQYTGLMDIKEIKDLNDNARVTIFTIELGPGERLQDIVNALGVKFGTIITDVNDLVATSDIVVRLQ